MSADGSVEKRSIIRRYLTSKAVEEREALLGDSVPIVRMASKLTEAEELEAAIEAMS